MFYGYAERIRPPAPVGTGPSGGRGRGAPGGGVAGPGAGRPVGQGDKAACDRQLGLGGRPGPEAPGPGPHPGGGRWVFPGGGDGGGGGGQADGASARAGRGRRPGGPGGRVRRSGVRLPGARRLVPYQDVHRFLPARRELHRPAHRHRRGGGPQLVVRGVPAPVPGLGDRDGGGDRLYRRVHPVGGRPHHRRDRGLCGEVQSHGAVGRVQGVDPAAV